VPPLELEAGEERTQIRELSGAPGFGLGRWLPALGCMALISSLMWNSHATWSKNLKGGNGARARSFVQHLARDRQRIQKSKPGPLLYVEALAPPYIGCPIGIVLAAMKIDAKSVPPGPGAYMVLSSGQLVPAS
jgi:hypothetical protein